MTSSPHSDTASSPQDRPRASLPKTILLIIIPVLAGLGLLETAARFHEVWHPPLTVDIGQGFTGQSRLFVPEPGNPAMMVTNPHKTVSFRAQTFRREKPPRTFRIFALGGSSVNYLDYEFPLLAQRLAGTLPGIDAAEIINCGGLSYGSHRLVLVAREVLGYQPDLVMVYSGHNEFEELDQLAIARRETVWLQEMLSHSALYRFIRDRVAARRLRAIEEARRRQEALAESSPDTGKTWNYVYTDTQKEARMRAYRANLAAIIEACRDARVPIVIGTVPSNLMRPNLFGPDRAAYEEALALFRQGRYEEGRRAAQRVLCHATRHQTSDIENGIIRELAAQYGVPLADVEAAVNAAEPHGIPGETLFNDHCHLNPDGNRILVQAYEAQIRRIFL